MRPEVHFIFALGQTFGTSPFVCRNGCLEFRWLSRQTLYFLMVSAYCLCNLGFVSCATAAAFASDGVLGGLAYAPWMAAYLTTSLVQALLVARREPIMDYVRAGNTLWEERKHDGRYNVGKITWPMHAVWFAMSFFFPSVTISFLICREPHLPVFWSSVFCPGGEDDDCPRYVVGGAVVAQIVSLFQGYLSILMMDLMPTIVAVFSTRALKLATEHLEEHKENCCTFSCEMPKAKKVSVVSVTQVAPQRTDHLTSEERTASKIAAIREVMRDHLVIQRCVRRAAPAFGPFIVLCIVQVFSMCVALFFTVIKAEQPDWLYTLIYLGNGAQFFTRGTVIFNAFGNVREQAQEMKGHLQTRMGLLEELAPADPSLVSEVHFFCSALDEVAVQAGPYFTCTHGFLFTFYGILATYLAVLVQSV